MKEVEFNFNFVRAKFTLKHLFAQYFLLIKFIDFVEITSFLMIIHFGNYSNLYFLNF